MDKLRRKRTSKVKNKKEADPSNANNAKLSTTHKFIISIALGIFLALCDIAYKEAKKHECEDRWDRSLGPEALGGGGIVRGLLKAGCGAESSYEHHYIHHRRGW